MKYRIRYGKVFGGIYFSFFKRYAFWIEYKNHWYNFWESYRAYKKLSEAEDGLKKLIIKHNKDKKDHLKYAKLKNKIIITWRDVYDRNSIL